MMFTARRVPIIDMVSQGQIEAARELIQKGSNVNERGECGNSALLAAVRRNDVEISRLLIEHGAKINIQDKFGDSPLSIARKNGYTEIIQLLETHLQQQTHKNISAHHNRIFKKKVSPSSDKISNRNRKGFP